MQRIQHKYGFEIIDNFPDYTPEQEKRANENLLEKLYEIFFHDEDKSK